MNRACVCVRACLVLFAQRRPCPSRLPPNAHPLTRIMGRDQVKKRRRRIPSVARSDSTQQALDDDYDQPRVSRQWQEADEDEIALPVKQLDGKVVFPAAGSRSSKSEGKKKHKQEEEDEDEDGDEDENENSGKRKARGRLLVAGSYHRD